MQAGGNQDGDALPGMPAACSRSSSGGRVSRLGAGRVMSQTEMAAVRFPVASSASGLEPMGWSSAAPSAAWTAQAGGRADFGHIVLRPIGQGDDQTGFAKGECCLHVGSTPTAWMNAGKT